MCMVCPAARKKLEPDVYGHEKTRLQMFLQAGLAGGSYRDRTDDIHGVNVALYQLS